jgi:hypothetical protein
VVTAEVVEDRGVPRSAPWRKLRRWWYRTPTSHVVAVGTCAMIVLLVGVLIAVH